MKITKIICGVVAVCCVSTLCFADDFSLREGRYAIFQTSNGGFVARLNTKAAASIVDNFALLAAGKKEWTQPVSRTPKSSPFFDNTDFYYVKPGKEIRGGDPLNKGTGGPGYSMPLNDADLVPLNEIGLICAETNADTCHGSRFRILLKPQENERGIVLGKIVQGMDNVADISKRPATKDGRPIDPVKILTLSIVDVPDGYHALGSFVEENGVRVVDINRSFASNAETTSTAIATTKTVNIKDEQKAVRVITSGEKAEEKKVEKDKPVVKDKDSQKGSNARKRQAQQRRPTANPAPEPQQEPRKKKLLFWRR